MSFWPFPTILLAELREAHRHGPVVEAGAGPGLLAARLRDAGIDVIPVDHDPRLSGLGVLCDLRRSPFAAASLGGVIFGDVLRHLAPADRAVVAEGTCVALSPGGRAVVFEDDPVGRDAAEGNYRDVLALLADLVPSRGPARPIDRLAESLHARLGEPVAGGTVDNEIEVDDPLRPLQWARLQSSCDAACRERIDDLTRRIERDGMRYGRYAFRVYRRDGAA